MAEGGGPSFPPSLPLLDEGGCEIPQDCLEESPWKSLYFAQKLEAEGKLQFSLVQGLGWVTGGRGFAESSGEVFPGVLTV